MGQFRRNSRFHERLERTNLEAKIKGARSNLSESRLGIRGPCEGEQRRGDYEREAEITLTISSWSLV